MLILMAGPKVVINVRLMTEPLMNHDFEGDFVFDVSAHRFNVPVSELNENLLGFETYYIEKYDTYHTIY